MHPAAGLAQKRLPGARARHPRRENQAVKDDAKATILVVDDDRALRDALRRVLALDGYEVRTAEGGAEALDAISSSLPDAVVLDVGMPGLDGLEVCRRLRRLQNRLPVLILTARDAIEDRIDGLDVGADDYMVKPFDVGELRARLRALLRRSEMGVSEDGGPQLSLGEVTLDSQRHGAVVRAPAPAVVAREGANGSAPPSASSGSRAPSTSCSSSSSPTRARCSRTARSTSTSGGTTSGPPRTRCACTSATSAASSRGRVRARSSTTCAAWGT